MQTEVGTARFELAAFALLAAGIAIPRTLRLSPREFKPLTMTATAPTAGPPMVAASRTPLLTLMPGA